MIKYIRYLFGLNEAETSRTVINQQVGIDVKDIPYIRDSNNRLNLLQNLYNRYKNTTHAPQIKAVYDKTKNLHTYLVGKKRVQELELFHLQNTDNFINTFTVILDVHQAKEENSTSSENTSANTLKRPKEEINQAVINAVADNPQPIKYGDEVPLVAVTSISINTYAALTYEGTDDSGNFLLREISFTSPEEEKARFLASISPRLGVYKRDISYLGNAEVQIAHSNNGSQRIKTVPVVHWRGCLYVIHLKDYRLFPVRINRRDL